MQINGLQSSSAVQALNRSAPTKASAPVQSPAASGAITDQLDLSAEAQALGEVGQVGQTQPAAGIRSERVDAIRQAIANGSYETPEKLSAALDRMLDSFA